MDTEINKNLFQTAHYPKHNTYPVGNRRLYYDNTAKHIQVNRPAQYCFEKTNLQNQVPMGRNIYGNPKWHYNSFAGTDARELTSAAHTVPKINTFKKYQVNLLLESLELSQKKDMVTDDKAKTPNPKGNA